MFDNFLGGNLSSSNYQNVLNFVASLVSAFSVDSAKLKVKVGMVIFGSVVQTIFSLGDYTDATDARNKCVVQTLCDMLMLCDSRILSSPYLASSTNIGDGLIRAWELHRDATSTRPSVNPADVSRTVFLFADRFASRGPEVGDGDFETAVRLISQRMKEGNFSGSSSNLLAVGSSAFQWQILIYTTFVTSQVSQQSIPELEAFLRYRLSIWTCF